MYSSIWTTVPWHFLTSEQFTAKKCIGQHYGSTIRFETACTRYDSRHKLWDISTHTIQIHPFDVCFCCHKLWSPKLKILPFFNKLHVEYFNFNFRRHIVLALPVETVQTNCNAWRKLLLEWLHSKHSTNYAPKSTECAIITSTCWMASRHVYSWEICSDFTCRTMSRYCTALACQQYNTKSVSFSHSQWN